MWHQIFVCIIHLLLLISSDSSKTKNLLAAVHCMTKHKAIAYEQQKTSLVVATTAGMLHVVHHEQLELLLSLVKTTTCHG